MSLVIGILVDDSTVVLENIERHFTELKQPPEEAAVAGREEIGAAAVVITLVDVVVFFCRSRSFKVRSAGRSPSSRIVVVISTLTSLFVSFTITPTLAGLWALRSHWKPWRVVDAFGQQVRSPAHLVHASAPSVGLGHGRLVAIFCARTFVLALALVGVGVVGEEFIPPVDRGEIFIQLIYPIGTPIQTVREGHLRAREADPQHSGYLREHGGRRRLRSIVRRLRLAEQRRPSSRLAQGRAQASDRPIGSRSSRRSRASTFPTGVNRGRRALDLDPRRKRAADRLSRHRRDRRRPDALRRSRSSGSWRKSRARPASTAPATQLAPEISIQFDRNKAQALGVDLGDAAQAAGAAFGGDVATQFETTAGLEQVQVIYPQSYQTSLDGAQVGRRCAPRAAESSISATSRASTRRPRRRSSRAPIATTSSTSMRTMRPALRSRRSRAA